MNKVVALLFVLFVSFSLQQTLCEKYATALGVNHTTLVTDAVVTSVTKILVPANGLLKYFDGSSTVPTNFLQNTTAYGILAGHLVSFFGQALGCSDGTIPAYTGKSMADAHATMGVNYKEYNTFNRLVLETLREKGFSEADTLLVADALNFGTAICRNADCTNICNKYSIPYKANNSALVGQVVTNVVGAALGSSLLKPFFDGTTPAGSTNFTDPSNAAQYATLATNLINFFGGALGCTDGSIPAYTGKAMKAAHASMPINNNVFNTFNNAVVSVMSALGVVKADTDAVLTVLESTRADICNQGDCFNTTSSGGSSQGSSSGTPSSGNTSSAQTSTKPTSSSGVTSKTSSSSSSSTGNGFVIFVSMILLLVVLF